MICFPCYVLGLVLILVVFRARDGLNKLPSGLDLFLLSLFLFYFLVEIKCNFFQKVVDYSPFEHVVEIVDHRPFIEVLIYILFWPCPFQKKK
jgi:hypothetical protein